MSRRARTPLTPHQVAERNAKRLMRYLWRRHPEWWHTPDYWFEGSVVSTGPAFPADPLSDLPSDYHSWPGERQRAYCRLRPDHSTALIGIALKEALPEFLADVQGLEAEHRYFQAVSARQPEEA